MGGLILLFVIFFVIVPIVKMVKESAGTDNSKNRNRYGGYYDQRSGYNNPNVYNDPNNAKNKITYDWKPDYNFVVKNPNEGDQTGQGNQGNQVAQPSQAQVNAQLSPAQASARPAPAQANARQSSAVANKRPSDAPADVRPSSKAVAGSSPVADEPDNNRMQAAFESMKNEWDIGKEAGMDAGGYVTDVHVAETLLKQDAVMPDYDSLGLNIGSYYTPESSAFTFTDVVVDAEVRVDAVISDPKDTVRMDMKDKTGVLA